MTLDRRNFMWMVALAALSAKLETPGVNYMTGFKSPIVGGQNSLLIPAIQSPNFETGVQGWQIKKNGSVEFNDGTFRGTVTAGTFEGTDFVINQSGAFFYSGTPATGNLVASITSQAGSNDGEGNPYKAGVTVYGANGTALELIAGNPASVNIFTGDSAQSQPGLLESGIIGSGPDRILATAVTSPAVTGQTDFAQALFQSPPVTSGVGGASVSLGATGANLQIGTLDGGDAQFTLTGVYAGTGAAQALLNLLPDGTLFVAPPLVAQTPGNPGLEETWHSVTVPSGMTGSIRVKRLTESNFACLDIDVTITSTSTSPVSFNPGSLPSAAYYPKAQRQYDLSVNQQFTNVGNASPRVNIPVSGAIGLSMPGFDTAGSTCLVSGTAFYPLD